MPGWLADHRVALTGCDTWSYGPYPPESPDVPFASRSGSTSATAWSSWRTSGWPTPPATTSANSCSSFPTPDCAGRGRNR
jgi:hypothetical protein